MVKKKTDEQTVNLQKQLEELKAKYLRALADYQNLEKRNFGEKQEIRRYAIQDFVQRLLAIVDTFENAQINLKDQGLALGLKELEALFTEYGIVKIEALGKEFNPHEMECLEVVDLPAQAGGEENKVLEVTQTGYKMHEKVIRPAKVKAGKGG